LALTFWSHSVTLGHSLDLKFGIDFLEPQCYLGSQSRL
jgi:hypothetical protein